MSLVMRVIQSPTVLDEVGSSQLYQEINQSLEAGTAAILVDLQAVEFVNSAGLLTLVIALRLVRRANGLLGLCCPTHHVTMLLELTGLDEVFEIFADSEEFKQTVFMQLSLRSDRRPVGMGIYPATSTASSEPLPVYPLGLEESLAY